MGHHLITLRCKSHNQSLLTQRGIAAALGLKNPGGNDFERLMGRKSLADYVGAELLGKIAQPIEFKWIYPGAKQTELTIRGYSADTLIDVCNAILAADTAGRLNKSQAPIAAQARIIVNASAKSGITSGHVL